MVCRGSVFPIGLVNILVFARTISRNMSKFSPWNYLITGSFFCLPSPASSLFTWENRKGLSHEGCQRSPCFPSSDNLKTPRMNSTYLLLSDLLLGFLFFPSLPSLVLQANPRTCGLLILSPFVSPKSLLHELFPLFLKSSITLSLHWLLPPLAINILRSPSS